jgi:hypothetical protein
MQTIYRKVNRRYVPIGLYEKEQQYLPNGAHLVIVKDGCTSTRYNISVVDAVVLAAVENVRTALVDALRAATELQPVQREYTPLEKRAWDAYKGIAGSPVGLQFEGVSVYNVVDKALEVLKKELLDGTIVTYLDENGYDCERERAREAGFVKGGTYTVVSTDVGNCSTSVKFYEIKGSWNSVMFEDI